MAKVNKNITISQKDSELINVILCSQGSKVDIDNMISRTATSDEIRAYGGSVYTVESAFDFATAPVENRNELEYSRLYLECNNGETVVLEGRFVVDVAKRTTLANALKSIVFADGTSVVKVSVDVAKTEL